MKNKTLDKDDVKLMNHRERNSAFGGCSFFLTRALRIEGAVVETSKGAH